MLSRPERSLRGRLSAGALLLAAAACATAATERVKIDLDYVTQRAKELSAKPYDDNWGHVPAFLRELSYSEHQEIRFNPLRALWSEDRLPFRIEFFHPGSYYNRAVPVHEFTDQHEQEIPFNTDFFDYGHQTEIRRRVPASLGYAGLRILYPINKAGQFDEVAVFAGAAYFRVTARGLGYGLSARCLAINTTTNVPEEFPMFREFWLGKPEAQADQLCLYALMDSPSVAGAYAFVLHPGAETTVDVRGRLFFRTVPRQLGLAPFSSMFRYGENALRKPPDYRPEAHDSDGVLLFTETNRCTWLPLDNPTVAWPARTFAFDQPIRFAVMQRDRDFEHYQDIDAAYQLRPNAIVEPGRWGPGRVVLYTFPAGNETVDNVAVLWQPDALPAAGALYAIDYTLRFGSAEPSPLGIVVATRTGRVANAPDLCECVVDFGGRSLAALKDVDPVKVSVESLTAVPIAQSVLRKNNFNGTWRLVIRFRPPALPQEAIFRAHLELEGRILTETWEYAWRASMN